MDGIDHKTVWYDEENKVYVIRYYDDKNNLISEGIAKYETLQELIKSEPDFTSMWHFIGQEDLQPIIECIKAQREGDNKMGNESVENVEKPAETSSVNESTLVTSIYEGTNVEDIKFNVDDFIKAEQLLKTICSSGAGFLGSLSGITAFLNNVNEIVQKKSKSNALTLDCESLKTSINDNVDKLSSLVGGTGSGSVSLSTLYERAKKVNNILGTFEYDYANTEKNYNFVLDAGSSLDVPIGLKLYLTDSQIAGFEMKEDGSGYLYDGMSQDNSMYFFGTGTFDENGPGSVQDLRDYYFKSEYGLPEGDAQHKLFAGRITINFYGENSSCPDSYGLFYCDDWVEGTDPKYSEHAEGTRGLDQDEIGTTISEWESKLHKHYEDYRKGTV